MSFDLAIIGGGPGGYTAAAAAARNGLSVVLFEKRQMGGTCLNRGCIPTKALIHASEEWQAIQNAESLGIKVEQSSFDFSAMHQRKAQVVDTLRQGIEKLMKANKVTVVSGEASIPGKGVVMCNGETYEAKDIIVATGSEPARIPIPGIDLPKVYTSDDLLEGDGKAFDSLIIIGGGVIGCEFASIYQALGCKVTIVEAADRILPTLDKEIAQRLGMYFKKRGIAVNAKAMVKEIFETEEGIGVRYEDKNGELVEVTAQGVLMSTGRRVNTEALFTGEYKPNFFRGAMEADEVGDAGIGNLYVIGDAKAKNIQLAHVAEAQAENVVAHIVGKPLPKDMNVIPSCVYTNPEIASVGLNETQAKEAGYSVKCAKYLSGANGKCLIEEAESGYMKLVTDEETGVILGAQLVYPRATDIIAELALAVQKKMKAEDIAHIIHPHPTFVEGVMEMAASILE